MPNTIGPTGLTVKTQAELIDYFTAGYKAIYGADINLDQDTPDGQWMMTQIQAILDQEDLLVQINNGFDPDLAIGEVLDQRVAINGIQRIAGTNTITAITIVTDRALNLVGKNDNPTNPYTIQDNAGNQWQLQESQTISDAGTFSYNFQAAVPGAVLTVPNTINIPVTIILGVTSINNPTTYITLGINEETDAQLKIRRQKSVSLASQGYLSGLLAALENLSGMNSAFVYENNTGSPNVDSVPGHTIWVIVSGTADPAEIANAIYTKRNAGCGLFGDQSFVITQIDGSPFVVYWDDVEQEDLFIKFTATSLDGINDPNYNLIKSNLINIFTPGVNEEVNINELATKVQQIDPNTLVTNSGFSTSAGGSYTNTLTPTSKKFQFQISQANIIILPILIVPHSASVPHGGSHKTFAAFGGHGTYTWSMVSGGGSINSSTGVYTSGIAGSDVIQVEDGLGNTQTAPITVT